MLIWSGHGALPRPELLQVRVHPPLDGRVRASAPQPSRSLGAEEVLENLRHFTLGMRGPRTRPVRGLILSGGDELLSALLPARSWGIEQVTLHLGCRPPQDWSADWPEEWVSTIVCSSRGDSPLWNPDWVEAARERGAELALSWVATPSLLQQAPELLPALLRDPPGRLSLSYPFPGGAELPSLASLEALLARLADLPLPVTLKGTPGCALSSLRPLLRRTPNRWYVDADHQAEQALLFLPEVLRFAREEACRFCSLSSRCDGILDSLRAAEIFPPLRAVSDSLLPEPPSGLSPSLRPSPSET